MIIPSSLPPCYNFGELPVYKLYKKSFDNNEIIKSLLNPKINPDVVVKEI